MPESSQPEWQRRLAVAAFALLASFAGIGSHSLWTPDEPRDAAVGKAMLESGDYLVPRLNGRPFLEKPPLYWWAQAACFKALGVGDARARVPSALFAALTLLLTYGMGRRIGGPRVGLFAAAVLATTAEFVEDMPRAVVDPPLVLFVSAAWFGFAVLEEPRSPAERRWAGGLVALAVPLAFLAKGVVGVGLGIGPPVLYLLALRGRNGRGAALRGLLPLGAAGAAVFAALVLPWALALVHEAGFPALRECLVGNTVGRLLSTEGGRAYGHRQPFWYYFSAGLPALLPWVLAVPAMVRAGLWRRRPGWDAGRLLFFCCGLGLLLLSTAASKRALYLVPLLPALAVCVASWLDQCDSPADPAAASEPARSWDRPTLLVLFALATALPILIGFAAETLHWIPWLSAASPGGIPLVPVRTALKGGLLRNLFGWVVVGIGLWILLPQLRRDLRTKSQPRPAWILVPYFLVFLLLQTAVKAAIEPLKNLHDLTAAISRLCPGTGPVTAYQPNESLFGIVGFDLDRRVAPLTGQEEIASYFASHPGGNLVLTVQALRRLPAGMRAHLQPLYDETGYKASPYAIVTGSGGAPEALPGRPGGSPR